MHATLHTQASPAQGMPDASSCSKIGNGPMPELLTGGAHECMTLAQMMFPQLALDVE